MAVVQHKNIADADLHQIKGAAAATVGQAPLATGVGTAVFGNISPRGASYFIDLASPYTLAWPDNYTKLGPTTTSTGTNLEYTVSTTGRLTYTGTRTLATRILANLSVAQASGANRELEFAIYKNGSLLTGSTVVITTVTAVKEQVCLMAEVNLATNDYVEVFVTNNGADGSVLVYSYYLTALGMQ